MSNSPSLGNPRIASTLLLVFLAGAAVGMLGMQYGLHDRLHRVAAAAAPSRETNKEAVLQNFKTKLDLSAEQTDQIAVVLQDYSHYYESLQDQLDDLRSTGLSRIRSDPPARPAREIREDANRAGPPIQQRTQKVAGGAGDLVACRIVGT